MMKISFEGDREKSVFEPKQRVRRRQPKLVPELGPVRGSLTSAPRNQMKSPADSASLQANKMLPLPTPAIFYKPDRHKLPANKKNRRRCTVNGPA